MRTATDRNPSAIARHTALVFLFLVGVLSYMDRYILVTLVEPIKAELHASDTQMGLLNGLSFALLYAILGVPVAIIADRTHRVRLISIACTIWSLSTAMGGMASQYLSLALSRMGVGIGEAGSTAPALSILADYYPPEKRPLITGIYTSSAAVGVFAGSALGGWMAKAYSWRDALLSAGAMGLLIVPMLLIFVREPQRGRFDRHMPADAIDVAPSTRDKLTKILSIASLRLVIIAESLAAFASIALLAWAPAFLMRVHEMDIAETGAWFGLLSGVALAVGALGGGAITTVLSSKSPRFYALVPCIFMLISAPFLVAALLVHSWEVSLALLLVPTSLTSGCSVPAMAAAQNLSGASSRATACALLVLAVNIIGVAGGPMMVGLVSDNFSPRFGLQSLQIGLLWVVPICLISSILFYRCSQILVTDMTKE